MAEDTPLYFDCMNESGLAAGGLLFAGFAEYEAKPVEGKLNVTAYELPLWVCRNFTTVDQAQAALEHVAIVGEGIAGMEPSYLHRMIADGTCLIVVDVLANQPAFDWHLENLRSYYMVDPCVLEARQWRLAPMLRARLASPRQTCSRSRPPALSTRTATS